MAPSELDYQQLVHLVHWLDEERQRAQVQVERLAAQVQVLSNADGVRSQGIAAVESEVRRVRGLEQRLGHLEQATREVLDPVADVRLRVEALERAVQQQAAVRDVTLERVQRQLSEIAQALEGLRVADVELTERVASVADEARRDRAVLPEYDARLDEVRQALRALGGRLALLEEDARRATQQVAILERRMEVVGRGQEHEREVLQLQQVQTQRRFGEWEERASAWQRTIGDGQAAALAARQQAQALANDVAELQVFVQRSADALAAQEEVVSEWRAQQTTLAHALAELRADLLSDREQLRSLEAQGGTLLPRLERSDARADELASAIAAQREYGEQAQAALRRLERHVAELDEQRRSAGRELRAHLEEMREAQAVLTREVGHLAERVYQRLAEVQQLEEQHRQRQISELEQQLVELQGRARPAQGTEAT